MLALFARSQQNLEGWDLDRFSQKRAECALELGGETVDFDRESDALGLLLDFCERDLGLFLRR